jgi:hypothetical protein
VLENEKEKKKYMRPKKEQLNQQNAMGIQYGIK